MKTLFTILLVLFAFLAGAQISEIPKVNFGLGMGMSYGGIVGGRLTVFPVKSFGVFAAAGYNRHKLAYNVGGIVRTRPEKKFCPVLIAMYGYNAVIMQSGPKTYYGPTVGVGGEVRFGDGQTFLNFEIVIPFRSDAFRRDVDAIKVDPTVDFFIAPLPIGICVGYHFGFRPGY